MYSPDMDPLEPMDTAEALVSDRPAQATIPEAQAQGVINATVASIKQTDVWKFLEAEHAKSLAKPRGRYPELMDPDPEADFGDGDDAFDFEEDME